MSEQQKNATRVTLLQVLETILRLLHPIIPFITESIWQSVAARLSKSGDTIMLQPYPEHRIDNTNEKAEESIQWIKKTVMAIRNVRGEAGISPAKSINVLCRSPNPNDENRFNTGLTFIETLAKLNTVSWIELNAATPASATTLVDQLEIHIPLAGLIDKQQEMSRLDKEIQKLEKELQKCRQKLDNPNYVNKAPAAVVEQERSRFNETQIALEKLQAHYSHIVTIE